MFKSLQTKILLVLLAILIGGSFWFFRNFLQTESQSVSAPKPKIKISLDQSAWQTALQANDPSLCRKITACEDAVYLKLAQDQNSLDDCLKIKNPEQKNQCVDELSYRLAILRSDASLCQEISAEDLRQKCEEEIAKAGNSIKGALGACSEIKNDEAAKSACEQQVDAISQVVSAKQKQIETETQKNSFETVTAKPMADSLNECQQESCRTTVYRAFVIKDKDARLCDKIASSAERDRCNASEGFQANRYWFRKALLNKKIEECDKISDQKLLTQCQENLSKN
jgi:hypothetical protein